MPSRRQAYHGPTSNELPKLQSPQRTSSAKTNQRAPPKSQINHPPKDLLLLPTPPPHLLPPPIRRVALHRLLPRRLDRLAVEAVVGLVGALLLAGAGGVDGAAVLVGPA